MERYESAKSIYKNYGVDAEKALERLKDVCISVHCWQGDDVTGFDSKESLSGGIQTTGNYLGRARTPDELMADLDLTFSLIPGKKKLKTEKQQGVTNLNPSTFPNGWSLQRHEKWESTLTPLFLPTQW